MFRKCLNTFHLNTSKFYGIYRTNKMNFTTNINLVDRASVSVVSSFWNQHDVVTDIKNLILGSQNFKPWINIENDVISFLQKIELPEELKLNLKNLLQPMGMQIFKWISLTQSIFQVHSHLPYSITFVWDERGILDYVKTAETIIRSSSDKVLCFCLASVFCMEKHIVEIWPHVDCVLSNKIKNDPCTAGAIAVTYWVYYFNGEIEKLMSLTEYCGVKNAHEFGFFLMLDSKCISSLKYFIKFATPDRKQRLIMLALQNIFSATRPHDGNIVVFLFSQLSEYEVNQIISENCYSVLASLLEWPCQEFFMPIANSSWSNLSNLDYLNLFQDMVEFASRYYLCNTYYCLIKQFWLSTPLPFKEYVKGKCVSGTFLSRLFLCENIDGIIQMFFNDCNLEEKQNMIFYFEGMNLCDLLVKKERWDSLKLLIKNCITDQSVLEEFIEEYENNKPCYVNKEYELRTKLLFEKIKEWY